MSGLASRYSKGTVDSAVISSSLAASVPKDFLKGYEKILATLSSAHGMVRKVSFPEGRTRHGPLVIHIQDVHANPEAQWNIRETVRALMEAGLIDLLALEGATGDIDLQPFVEYPDRIPIDKTAEFLLQKNKISGPIHGALTFQGKLPRILGIEDPVHYDANVQAYRDSLVGREAIVDKLHSFERAVKEQKQRVFSPSLWALDQKIGEYRSGKVPLGDHVQLLQDHLAKEKEFPEIKAFNVALDMERSLNIKEVERERAALIGKLAALLTSEESQSLISESIAYRSGQVRYAVFYRHLTSVCQKKGINLSHYPVLDTYVRYVLLSDGIQVERLIEEIGVAEKKITFDLAHSEEERDLLALSRQGFLTRKLVEFTLIPSEWEEYSCHLRPLKFTTEKKRGFQLPSVGDGAEKLRIRGGFPSLTFPLPAPLPPAGEGKHFRGLKRHEYSSMPRVFEGNLAPFETFYQEAKTRDRTMVRQLIVGMGELPKNRKAVAVLVAGGFHGDGVIRRLTEKGVTVVSFTPKVTKADTEGAGSLSIFTQEKTPLEKLFLGEKLTLAQPPLFPEARSRIGFMAWARALWLGKGTLSSEVLTDLEKLRASPELAVKQLRYENGVLFLEMNGREVPVISQEGNLTVDIESEIDRSPLPPLSKRLQAVATEFVYFASARVSHQLTRFVFQSHRVGNKNMHVLALRLLGIERIIQATDVGFLFGIVFGVSFGWWWFPLTWFSVYAVTHLAQQHLFPNAPAMADPPESNPLALLTEKGRSLVEAGELAEASRVFQQVRDQFLELSAHNGNGRLTGRELSLWIKQTGTSDVFNVEELQEILAQHPIELPDVGRFLLASLYLSSGYYQRAGPQSFEDQESSEQKPREALPLRSQLITVGPLHENGFMRTGSTPYLYKSQDQKKKFVVKYLGARSLPEMLSLKVFQYLGFNVEDTGVPPGETGYVITSWVDGTMNVSEYIRSTLISPVYFRPSAIGEKIFPSSIRNILEGSKLAAMIVDLTDFNLGNVLLHVNEKGEILPRRPVFIDFEKSFYFMTNSETGFGVMEKRYRNGFSRDDFFGGWDTNRLMREPLFHRNALIENMRWLYPAVASLSKEDIKRFVSEAVASVAPLTPLGKLGDDQEGLESKLWEGVQSALELYQLDVGEGGLAKQIKGKRFASIGNERALIKWGWDNLSYGAYTVRQAPLWEVIYQIPGLPQRVVQVLSDWFVRRLVGEDEKSGEPVVAEVRHQNAITLMGTLVLITGLIGGGGWIIPGTIIWALMSGYVFSESHRGRTTSEKRQILFVGFVLALSFLGPSLVLFWLDPIGFGWGLKALAYAGGLLFGYGLNVGIHSIYNVTALSHGWATATLAEKGKGPFDKEATKSFAVKIGDMVVLHKLVTKYIQNAQKTLKSGMDGKPFSAELAERSRSIRGELLVLARKTSPHFAELYKDIHNDQLDDIYALSGFLRNVFLFIYIPMGWAMGVVGKTGQVPMIDREGWQRLSYMGGTLWVGWASSGVSEKLMTTGVSSIELPGFVFVDPVGTKAYALSVWRDIAKFTHKSVLEQKWVALFKESHSTPIGFVEAILEKLIRDRLAYSKLSLYASRKMKIPLEKLTEEDIVKAVVSPSWKWREELRPLLGEFDIDLEDEDLSFLLDGVAHEILSILDSHIELMRFMVSHETKIESKEGDGALLNSNRKKFIFGVAVWNIVEMMRTAQTGLSGHPRRVMASKFLINAMADELGIPKGPSQETEHDARRESLLLQNLLQERGTDLDRFLSTLVSIRDRLMLSPEERFNHLNARVPTLDEIDELYTNIPLGKGRLHLKNGVTGVKKPLARFRQSVNPKTRLLLERAKIVLSTLGHEEEIRAAEFVKRLYSLADGLDHLVMDYSPDRLKAFTGEMVRLREESSKHTDNKEVGDIMGLVESIYGDTVMAIYHNRLEETQSHINPEDIRIAIQGLLDLEADQNLLKALPFDGAIELDEFLASARSLLSTQGPFPISDVLDHARLFGLEEQEVEVLRRGSETEWLDTDRAIMENLKEKLGKSFPVTLSDALALWVLPGKIQGEPLGYELYLSPEVSEAQWNEHGLRVAESIRRLRAGLASGLMPGSWVELKPHYPRVYRGRLGDSRVYVRFLPRTTGRPDMVMAILGLGPKSNFTTYGTHGSISPVKIGHYLRTFVSPEDFHDPVFHRFSFQASDSRGGLDSTQDTQPASLGYWIAKRLGINEQRSRSMGLWGLLLEIPALVALRALGEGPGPMGIGAFAFLGMDPFSVSLLLIVFFLAAGLHFVSARKVNKRAGRDPPSLSYLWKTVGVFALYLLPGSVVPAILVHLVIDLYELFFNQWRENQNWLAAHLPGLTEPQREIARDVLKNLEGRPISLGVGELRELVIKRAEVYAEGRHGVSVPFPVPEASSVESRNLVILPQGDLSPEGLHNLKKWMEKDETLVLVTDVSQESLPASQVIVVPRAFRTLGQQAPIQEVDLALVREALDGLGAVARGVPFQLYHAAALGLDESNLGEGDPLRQAAQNALVILLENMKAFPVGITGWNDILAVFQALAQAA